MSSDFSKHTSDALAKPTEELPLHATQHKPGAREQVKRGWGPFAAIFYVLFLYIVSQVLALMLVAAFLIGRGNELSSLEAIMTDSVLTQFFYILLTEVVTIFGVFWFVRRRRKPLRAIGWGSPRWAYLWKALGGFLVYFLAYLVAAKLIKYLVPSLDLEQKQEIGFETVRTHFDLVLTFVSLAVLPPLAEEIVFRGFMFTGLRQKLSFVPATIVTSVLFGIAHLQFGGSAPLLWVAAIDTFILSSILCYVRERTQSLWPAIYIHALKNSIAFLALFIFQ